MAATEEKIVETPAAEAVVETQNPPTTEVVAPVIDDKAEIEIQIPLPKRNVKGEEKAVVVEKIDTPPIMEYWKNYGVDSEDSFKETFETLNKKSKFIDETPEDVLTAMIIAEKEKRTFREAYQDLMALDNKIEIPEDDDFIYTDAAKDIYLQGEKMRLKDKYDEQKASDKYDKVSAESPILLAEKLQEFAEKINTHNEKKKEAYYKDIESVSDREVYKVKLQEQQQIIEKNTNYSGSIIKSVETALKADAKEYVKIPTGEQDPQGNEVTEDVSYYSRTKEDNDVIKTYAKQAFDLALSQYHKEGARPLTKQDLELLSTGCYEQAKKTWVYENQDKIHAQIFEAAKLYHTKQEFANLGAGAGQNNNSQPPVTKIITNDKKGNVDTMTGIKFV